MNDGAGDDIDLIWGPKPGAETGATVAPIASPVQTHQQIPAVSMDDDPLAALESMTGGHSSHHAEKVHANPIQEKLQTAVVDEPLLAPVSDRQRADDSPPVAAEKVDVLAAMNRAREKAHRENFGTATPSVLAAPETTSEVMRRAPQPVENDATTLQPRPVVLEQTRAREHVEVSQSSAVRIPVATDVAADDWSTPAGITPGARVSATPVNMTRSTDQMETTERHQADDGETAVHHRPMQRPTNSGGIRKGFVVIAAGFALLAVAVLVFIEPVKRYFNSDTHKPFVPPSVELSPRPIPSRVQNSTAPVIAASEQTPVRQPQGSDPTTTAVADPITRVADSSYVSPFQTPLNSTAPAPTLPAKSVPPALPGQSSSAVPAPLPSGGPIAVQAQGQGQLRLSASEPDFGKEKFAEMFGAQELMRKDVDGINKRLNVFKTSFDSMTKKVESFDAQLAEIRRIVSELKRTPIGTARLNAPNQPVTTSLPAPIAIATPVAIAKAVKLQAIVPDFAVIGIDNDARTVKVGDDVPSLGRVSRIDVANTRVTFESGYVLGIH